MREGTLYKILLSNTVFAGILSIYVQYYLVTSLKCKACFNLVLILIAFYMSLGKLHW